MTEIGTARAGNREMRVFKANASVCVPRRGKFFDDPDDVLRFRMMRRIVESKEPLSVSVMPADGHAGEYHVFVLNPNPRGKLRSIFACAVLDKTRASEAVRRSGFLTENFSVQVADGNCPSESSALRPFSEWVCRVYGVERQVSEFGKSGVWNRRGDRPRETANVDAGEFRGVAGTVVRARAA